MRTASRTLLVASAAAVAVLLLIHKVVSHDIWFHLRAGEWLLAGGGFPDADPFSFTADQPGLNQSWLFQIPLALAHRAGGIAGAILFNAALLGAALLLLARRGWRARIAPETIAGLLALAVLASIQRLFVRPESVTLLLLVVSILAMEAALAGRRRWVWLFPPLMLLWVNAEALFPLGLAIYAAGALEALRRALFTPGEPVAAERGSRARRGIHWLYAWKPAGWVALLVCLANPYGLRGVLSPLTLWHATDAGTIGGEAILELQSPLAAGMATASLLPAAACAAVLLILVLSHRRHLNLFRLLVLLGAGSLAMLSVRHIPLFACAATAVVLAMLGEARWVGQRRRAAAAEPAVQGLHPRPRGMRGEAARGAWAIDLARLGLGLAGLLVAIGIVTSSLYDALGVGKRFGLGTDPRRYPRATLAALRALGPPRVMNDLGLGHLLIWALGPETRVFLDGRSEVYSDRRLRELRRALSDDARFTAFASASQVDYALLRHQPEALRRLITQLVDAGVWRVRAYDNVAVLLAREDAAAHLIPGAPPEAPILPGAPPPSVITPEMIPAARRVSPLARWFAPGGREIAELHLPRATLAFALGDLERGAAEALAAARADPGRAGAFNNLGAALLQLGSLPAAEGALHQVLALEPEHVEALTNLGLVAQHRGQPAEAASWLRRALEAAPEDYAAHLALGSLLSQRGAAREAERHLRAAHLREPAAAAPLLELGWLAYREDRPGEAARLYSDALQRGADYRGNLGLALALTAAGRPLEAQRHFARARARAPDELARRRVDQMEARTGAPSDRPPR